MHLALALIAVANVGMVSGLQRIPIFRALEFDVAVANVHGLLGSPRLIPIRQRLLYHCRSIRHTRNSGGPMVEGVNGLLRVVEVENQSPSIVGFRHGPVGIGGVLLLEKVVGHLTKWRPAGISDDDAGNTGV